MTTYVADESGAPLCVDCATDACKFEVYWCEAEHCQCPCQVDRAAALDDRPVDKLHVVANELEAERRGDLRDLVAERFRNKARPGRERPGTAR